MPEENQAKIIGLAEAMFVVLLIGAEEFIEFIILILTLGVGIMIVEIMNIGMFAAIEMYMLLRGGKGIMKLIVEPIGTAINGATGGLAPGKTVATVAGIWIINNPEKIEKLTKVFVKVGVQVAAIAAGAVTGGAGGVAVEAVGSKVAGAAAQKAATAAIQGGARQRMAMAVRSGARQTVRTAKAVQSKANTIGDAIDDVQAIRGNESGSVGDVDFKEAA